MQMCGEPRAFHAWLMADVKLHFLYMSDQPLHQKADQRTTTHIWWYTRKISSLLVLQLTCGPVTCGGAIWVAISMRHIQLLGLL